MPVEYLYTQRNDTKTPIMLIDKHIGVDENGVRGIMGDVFLRELLALENEGKQEVEIWINSVGGVVLDGWSIYGAIRNSRMKVTTVNIGIAASTAGWIFEAGHNRVMMDYSVLMMHMPHGGNEQGQDEISTSIATMLAEKSNKSISEVLNLMQDTTFMTADEAYRAKFCDEVRTTVKIPEIVQFVSVTNEMDKWKAGESIKNQLLPKKYKMVQVATELGLNADANEAAMLKAIVDLKNSFSENDFASMKEKHDAMEAKCNEMESKYNELMKAHNELLNAGKEADCRNLAVEFATLGAITNSEESIALWANNAKIMGIDVARKTLESLEVTRKMPVNVSTTHNTAGINFVPTTPEEYKNQFKNKK